MEIRALSSSLAAGYASPTAGADGAVARSRQVMRDSAELATRHAGAQNTSPEAAGNSQAETLRKEVREPRDAQKASAPSTSFIPHIKFKDSDGTRVMEVYDSKNVLIYQVPPKGSLILIQNQEQQTDPQIETSA